LYLVAHCKSEETLGFGLIFYEGPEGVKWGKQLTIINRVIIRTDPGNEVGIACVYTSVKMFYVFKMYKISNIS
jgi:hypothetical protein